MIELSSGDWRWAWEFWVTIPHYWACKHSKAFSTAVLTHPQSAVLEECEQVL